MAKLQSAVCVLAAFIVLVHGSALRKAKRDLSLNSLNSLEQLLNKLSSQLEDKELSVNAKDVVTPSDEFNTAMDNVFQLMEDEDCELSEEIEAELRSHEPVSNEEIAEIATDLSKNLINIFECDYEIGELRRRAFCSSMEAHAMALQISHYGLVDKNEGNDTCDLPHLDDGLIELDADFATKDCDEMKDEVEKDLEHFVGAIEFIEENECAMKTIIGLVDQTILCDQVKKLDERGMRLNAMVKYMVENTQCFD